MRATKIRFYKSKCDGWKIILDYENGMQNVYTFESYKQAQEWSRWTGVDLRKCKSNPA